MHESSLICGRVFAEEYAKEGGIVLDIGGRDANGSLRNFFVENGMRYFSVDLENHNSVDILISPGEKFPIDDGSVDLVVSSCYFHRDPLFWLTFREICRVLKVGGHFYLNVPSAGEHNCPSDSWRFYLNTSQSLAYWSGMEFGGEKAFPTTVIETFFVLNNVWHDFVCVWERVEEKEEEMILDDEDKEHVGPLEAEVKKLGGIVVKTT